MKNYVPLILAVILGVAAVLSVSRLLRDRHQETEKTLKLVVAARDIEAGRELDERMLVDKKVPLSLRPRQAVAWSDRQRLYGLRPTRTIRSGDYILDYDFDKLQSLGDLLAPSEWAVTIEASGGMASQVQPGDEVAIIGSLSVKETRQSLDASAPPVTSERDATLVLFPRVRVLDTGSPAGGQMQNTRRLVVGLPPAEAQVLIAAQRRMELTLALRRSGDGSALRREDAGLVDESTFAKLFQNVEPVVLPSIPGNISDTELK